MLCTAQLRHRETCCLTVLYVTPRNVEHGPHHRFPGNDDPWPAKVRECPHQCAEEHLHCCRRKQGPRDQPGCCKALVSLFHTTGTHDPRLRLVHPTRAKQHAQTSPGLTPNGLHLNVGGFPCKGDPTPPQKGLHPTRRRPYFTFSATLVDGVHQEPNADVTWPESMRAQPQAPMPVWLVTTDEHCAQAAEQSLLWNGWVVLQVGAGQP